MTDGYNGWKNWETWNVALWLSNDEPLYRLMREANDYDQLAGRLREMMPEGTPDGAKWDDPALDYDALNDMMEEDHR